MPRSVPTRLMRQDVRSGLSRSPRCRTGFEEDAGETGGGWSPAALQVGHSVPSEGDDAWQRGHGMRRDSNTLPCPARSRERSAQQLFHLGHAKEEMQRIVDEFSELEFLVEAPGFLVDGHDVHEIGAGNL